MKNNVLTRMVFFGLLLGFSSVLFAQTTIVVDWALDEVPDSNRHTCTYTLGTGALFAPAPDGHCTLRRALREAGARPAADRPITINFTGLNGADGNADDGQFNGAQWIIPVSDASSASDFGIFPFSITDVLGDVRVVGFAGDVQNNNTMPQIMIESGQPLEIEMSDVTIERLGFYGGMTIFAKEANITVQGNTWGLAPNGNSVFFADPIGNIDVLAGNHGVLSTNKADNLLVQNNIITGAGTYAIEVNSGTTGVRILNNWIGTNIDGEVPDVPAQFKCRTFTTISPPFSDLDPSEWFAGAGISAAGTGLIIDGNIIAGLQNIRSTNDTPPQALEVFGRLHNIQNNTIGQDVSGSAVGVCGQGIKFSTGTDTIDPQNNGHLILNNIINASRNGFENTKGAILWTDTTVNSFLDGGNTVRGNLVINGPEKYFEIGPMLTAPIKAFEPAEIFSINGTTVIGGNDQSDFMGNPSPCPNCIIDFYLDDDDAKEEALAYLGSTMADANGDFTFTLAAPLASGFGIRTTSTSTANNVIPNTWNGQTSEMSNVVYGLDNDIIFVDGFE